MSNEIGKIIRARRESNGWNLEELSSRLNVTISALSKMESGAQRIDSKLLINLSEILVCHWMSFSIVELKELMNSL